MATRRAVASGNWSATGTWNGGVVPTNGDTVYSNGFIVTINQDIDIGGANNPIVNAGSFVSGQWYAITSVGTTSWISIGAASNTAGTVFLATGVGSGTGTALALATITTAANTPAGAAAGGGFTMSTVYAMTADLRAGTTQCLNVTATTGTLTLSGIRALAGSASGAHAVNNNSTAMIGLTACTITAGGGSALGVNNASTGTINIDGFCTFNGGGGFAHAISNASTGTINVSGSNTFTAGAGNGGFAINNASTGTINVTGSSTFNGGGQNAPAINNASTGSITVSGSCTFTGGIGAAALNNASTGSVIVTNSTFAASAFANAVSISSTAADVRLSGDFLDHWSGLKAVSGGKWRLGTAPTLGQTRYALAGTTDSYFTMYGADNGSFGNPIAANVRSGVSYGGGNLTGSCAVPTAGSVALGVPVDATTGTAVLTPAAIRAELATELARIDTTISSRLSPSGTLATVTTLTNAPSSVTPSDIWSHATRTLTSASGPTAAENATAVWGAATRTVTGGTVDTLTNAPSVPSASAIASQVRTELTTELNRLDTNVGSRAASGTLAADITAIKAKTDAINVDRVNNTATLSQVGNLLAQANS
jgi:hypothetical protein